MISVIICSVDNSRFVAVQAHYEEILVNTPHEIIRISDAKSMCEGYSRGFAQSRGEILFFSHDDIEFWTPEAATTVSRALAEFDVVGVAGTNRLVAANWFAAGPAHTFGIVCHPGPSGYISMGIFGAPRRVVPNIQALDGLFIACRRSVAQRIPWDAQTFSGFHLYDLDWSFRAYLAGLKLGVITDLPVFHQSGGNYSTEEWRQAADAFLKKHEKSLGKASIIQYKFAAVLAGSRKEAVEAYESICLSIDGNGLRA